MRRFLAAMVLMVVALPAAAQDWYARGTFGTTSPDPWTDTQYQMTDEGGGHYTRTIGGFFPNLPFEYKIANLDFSTSYPGSNGKIVTNGDGELNFHLWTNDGNPWTDGWFPNNTPRVGYDDPAQFGWEVIGSFNNWRQLETDPVNSLSTTGDGVYTGSFALDAGIYQYKFRQQDSWDTRIGADFGNDSANNSLRVWDDGDVYTFKLDLPNGRWQATTTAPTPDLNGDDYVDAQDYVLWRKSNGPEAQYTAWRKHFGAVPPPPPPTQFYARGEFNGYDESIPLVDQGSDIWDATVTGLTPGQAYKFKLANSDYSQEAPQGSFRDGKVVANAEGEIKFHLYNQTTWTDGWFPNNERRAGYDDPGIHDWELMGDFNGFAGGPTWIMNNEGSGLYTLDNVNLADGTYGFKFRRNDAGVGDWSLNIGESFANDHPNNASTGLLTAGLYSFELDLRNGRWRVVPTSGSGSSLAGGAVPEPASVAMAMMALLLVGLVRRRERG